MKNIMRTFGLTLGIVLLTACAAMTPKSTQPAAKDALYRELGGMEGITRVVDLSLQRINSERRNERFSILVSKLSLPFRGSYG